MKAYFYNQVVCPDCGWTMLYNRHDHIVECPNLWCEQLGIEFHAPSVELVPVEPSSVVSREHKKEQPVAHSKLSFLQDGTIELVNGYKDDEGHTIIKSMVVNGAVMSFACNDDRVIIKWGK